MRCVRGGEARGEEWVSEVGEVRRRGGAAKGNKNPTPRDGFDKT